MEIRSFVPHPKSEVNYYFNGQNDPEGLRHLRPPGGLDLTKTRHSIEFKSDNGKETAIPMAESVLPFISAFEGFEFQIIQYQPIENPAKLFLSSTDGKDGAWFTHEPYNGEKAIGTLALIR